MRKDKAILELQQQLGRLTRELEQVRGLVPTEHQNQHHQELDVGPIDIAYSPSYEDYNDKDRGIRRRRHPRDFLRDFKVVAPEFDGNLNPKKLPRLGSIYKKDL